MSVNEITINPFDKTVASGPGAGIKKFDTTSPGRRSIIEDMKVRYVFSPLLEIPLFGRNINGPMSTNMILRGRLNYLQECPYLIRDESDAAMLAPLAENEDTDLAEHINTPFAQALYLHQQYSQQGLVVLTPMNGLDPDIALVIDEVLFPNTPETLIQMGRYLRNEAKDLIRTSGLPARIIQMVEESIDIMVHGCQQAHEWCNAYINDLEREIIAARNGKMGKGFLEDFDHHVYRQIERREPREKDLEFAAAKDAANEAGNDRLAQALERIALLTAGGGSADQTALIQQLMERLERTEQRLQSQAAPVKDTFAEEAADREEQKHEELPTSVEKAKQRNRRG
jgi:hypothetical protein